MAEDKIQYSLSMDIPFFQVPNNIFDIDIEVVAEQRVKKKGVKETVIVKRPMKPQEKLAYIYLCRCGNNGRKAFPSYKTIGLKCGISRRSAIEAVEILERNSLIQKIIRPNLDSNKYIVNSPQTSVPSAPTSAPGTPPTSAPSAPTSEPGAPKKEQLKKNNIEKEQLNNNVDFKSIGKEYFNTYKKLMSGTVINLIQSYIDDGMEQDVIIHAIRLSTKAKSFNYTKAILDDWTGKGLKSMEDVKQLEGLNKPLAATIDAISKVNLGG